MDEESTPMVIDPAALDRIWDDTGGDGEFVSEIIDEFLTDTRMRFAAFIDAIGAGDAATAGDAVHSLKGASTSVGARALAELALAAERACRDGDVATASGLITQMKDVSDQTAAALLAERQRFGAGR
jgi:HPt (histidine-containing phosphotransfer) domain-containing protein